MTYITRSFSAFVCNRFGVKRALGCLLLLTLFAASAMAQTNSIANYGSVPSGLAPGSPVGSQTLSELENVSPYNASLNVAMPLLKVGGRGGAGYTMMLRIPKTSWTVEHLMRGYACGGESGDGDDTCYFWDAYPRTQWWTTVEPGYDAGTLQGHYVGSEPAACPYPGGPNTYGRTFTSLTFTTPDGTEHALYDEKTGGAPLDWLCQFWHDPNRGRVFSSKDGSGLTFVADQDIEDRTSPDNVPNNGLFWPSGYLKTKDGTVYRFYWGRVEWMRDRNGNKLTFTYDTPTASCGGGTLAHRRVIKITDSLDREVNIVYGINEAQYGGWYDRISYKGTGGQERVIRVTRTALSGALRPNSGYQVTTYTGLFPQLSAPPIPCGTGSTFNPGVVSHVWLPDGARNFRFYYNPYHELARLELPTGGAVEYEYWPGVASPWLGNTVYPSGQVGTKTPYGMTRIFIYRRLRERRLYPNGGSTPALKTDYSRVVSTPNGEYVQVDEKDATAGDQLKSRQRLYYNGNAASSIYAAIGGVNDGVAVSNDGKEYRREDLSADGNDTVLKRVENVWELGWMDGPPNGTPWAPYLKETTTSLLDTATGQYKVSKQEFSYDQYNNPTDTYEYDFGDNQPGPLLRRTHVDYVTAAGYTDAVNGPHLRGLIESQWVSSDAGGANKFLLTAYGYDQSALTNCPGITGLDPGYGSGFTVRGNVTGITAYTNASTAAGAITTTSAYDVAGNVVSTTDALNRTTTFDYADAYSDYARNTYAYRTRTTSPVPDPSGQYGSMTPFATSSVYDYHTGFVASTTDADGRTTTFDYNDPLDRLKAVVRPAGGGRSDYEYVDTVGAAYVRTRTDLDTAGRELESYQYFDKMGRAVRSFQLENSDPSKPWLRTDTEYDAMGRVKRVSQPYRSALNSTPSFQTDRWTENTYDALGRAEVITTKPDDARIVFTFGANETTTNDPGGKSRRNTVDALGRLTRVVEDPGGAAHVTSYAYDPLNNLRKVDQEGQLRYFMFDSLSRLVRVRNPEQATNGALAVADNYTAPGDSGPNTQWTAGHSYDANDNLYQSTDARNVTATYGFDGLNRHTQTTYSDGTQPVERYYDTYSPKGEQWRSSSGGNVVDTMGHDTMGRPNLRRQWFSDGVGWRYYDVNYGYDLSGNVTGMTYPSGRTASYQYDAAGRVSQFSGTLGNSISRTYLDGVQHDDAGRLSQERYGTQTPIYNKHFYNVRGQLSEIRVATTPNDTFWNRGAIINRYSNQSWAGSGTDNNGNLLTQMIYIPNDDQISGYQMNSLAYTYDSLNRLDKVEELRDGSAFSWRQDYDYDRWGNRTINQSNTTDGLPEPAFETGALQSSNQLYAPGDLGLPMAQRRIRYDDAGNQTTDTYTAAAASRVFDAESRITQETHAGGFVSGRYAYDSDGRRVRRTANGQETWYVYGLYGELLAEYSAGFTGSAASQEYGYRNGDLLVIASPYGDQGLQADYFNSLDFTNPALTRTDAAVDFEWHGAAPGPGVNPDIYTARWTGFVTPRFTETYTFYTQTDDGVRLRVNGQLLIDKWIDQGWTEWSGQITLEAGKRYSIQMDFYERYGGAISKLFWSSPSQGKEIIPSSQLTPPQGASVKWLVKDQLGTPRMILDQTGSLARMTRHDYLPFGEEIGAGRSGRTFQQGYLAEGTRQQFTGKERDYESSLDYFLARYYSSAQGRFTSVDPENAGASPTDPQSWNAFAYARNSPVVYTDPNGMEFVICGPEGPKGGNCARHKDEDFYRARRVGRGLNHEFTGNGDFYEGGQILDEAGNVIATYQQVSIDSAEKEAIFQIRRRLVPVKTVVEWIAAVETSFLPMGNVARLGKVGQLGLNLLRKACFVAGTPVLTRDGLKPIEEVRAGDEVLSYNEGTGQTEYQRVVQTFGRDSEDILSVSVEGEEAPIGVTPEHPFYVRGGEGGGEWREAGKLQAGDEVRLSTGGWSRVLGVGRRTGATPVYNFEVAVNHNYFVGRSSLLVHNNNLCLAAQIAAKVITKYGNLECLQCAKELVKELRVAGIKGQVYELKSTSQFIVRRGQTGGEAISHTGQHYGVKVGDMIFDNFHPDGIPFSQWKEAYESAGRMTIKAMSK